MNLPQALRFLPPPSLRDTSPKSFGFGGGREGVAFTGSGGKTTALFQLAHALSGATREAGSAVEGPVIVTATTHLHVDQVKLADSHWIGEKSADFAALEENLHGVMLVTGPVDGDRTKGLDEELIRWLHELCGAHNLPLLIEADGSRQRPLKAPAEHEPVVPEFVGTVVVVAGLSGLGKLLTDEYVHRAERFRRLAGATGEEAVTPEMVVKVLSHPDGGLKGIPEKALRVALLNQADTPELQSIGGRMAQDLLVAFDAVVVGTLERAALQTFEPTAGIILAAGGASRFGSPKQLLDWHGKPFVRQVAETALSAGLSPVVVVTGAYAEASGAAVHDLPLTISHNPNWKQGLGSSLQTGLASLSQPHPAFGHPPLLSPVRGEKGRVGEGKREVGSAVFLLADQPQVPPTLLRALVEQHCRELSPIVAPLVQGQRSNPVLFDRVTFPELMSITGDLGGRAIFSKFPVAYVPWHDESLLIDVDTPEDLKRLLERSG